MRSDEGVRFELRLLSEIEGGARYRVSLQRSLSEWLGEAEIRGDDGAVEIRFRDAEEPPAWCTTVVRATLRAMFRERGVTGRFPRRVARWRPSPEPGGGDP
jgi:hypothetical protein